MDLPIFHDQRSSDKQIQIKTMHNYYSVYGIQRQIWELQEREIWTSIAKEQ